MIPLLLVGTLMDNFNDNYSKNNSKPNQEATGYHPDSCRTEDSVYKNRTENINDCYFQKLNYSRENKTDNFQLSGTEKQLCVNLQQKMCEPNQQQTRQPFYINEKNNFSLELSYGSSVSCDLTAVNPFEKAEPFFPSPKDPRIPSYKRNLDLQRRKQHLLQTSSEAAALPFPNLEIKSDLSCIPSTSQISTSFSSLKKETDECLRNNPDHPSVENRSEFCTFRFMKIRKRLGICAADHPRICLNFCELQAIKADILEKIFEPEGQLIKPRFFGTGIYNGYLVLICGDHTTVSWVKELPKKLRAPNGGPLKIVEEPYDDKSYVATGFFPNSVNDSNARILKFLEIQNEGLDISKWKILSRNEEKNAVRLTFSVDCTSAGKLKSKGPVLNFKFGGARFLLKTKKGIKFIEEELDDDNDPYCCEDFPLTPTQFLNPFVHPEVKKFKSEEFLLSTIGKECQIPPAFYEISTEYQSRIAEVMEQSRKALLHGLTSRERFLWKKNKRKKKKKTKKKAKLVSEKNAKVNV